MKPTPKIPAVAAGLVLLLVGSGLAATRAPQPVEAIQAETEIPAGRLLDVGILVFDPGLGDLDKSEMEEKGIFPEVRKAEARFIPYQLKNTLEATGNWGAVRVIPAGSVGLDLTVWGRIGASTGHDLELRIRVVDATGRVWREREYRQPADGSAYHAERIQDLEPYRYLYNLIANDILAARNKLRDGQIGRIRQVSALRFAAQLAPGVFGDYLQINRRGRYSIERLPSEEDPMWSRISRLRERDYLFIDTLNEYYADFSGRMHQVYYDWRLNSYEEREAFLEMRAKARRRKWLGGLLIVAGVLADDEGVQDAAVIGGAAVIQSGVQKGKEALIHREALRELGASFDAEVAPILVEVEGHTLRLEGSAETQFSEWRRLLRDLFTAETGLPVDPNRDRPETGPSAGT